MIRRKSNFIITTTLLSCAITAFAEDRASRIKVACVGDSITFGHGIENRDKHSYPAQLSGMLGGAYEVKNFGFSGATLLKKGDLSYWELEEFKMAQEYQPDVVIIKLGTNDTKSQNWIYKADFEADYLEMIKIFQSLNSEPKVWVCCPIPVFAEQSTVSDVIVKNEVIPLVENVAKKSGVKVIDLYTPFYKKSQLVSDGVHPNVKGSKVIAETVFSAIIK